MNNIELIQKKLHELSLDAVLISDEKNQRYALGFPFTDGAALISRRGAWLITDSRYIEAARAAVGTAAEVVQFDAAKGLYTRLGEIIEGEGLRRVGAEEERLSHAAFMRAEDKLGVRLENAQGIFKALRAAKGEEELAAMRAAQAIAEAALEETLPLVRAGVSERELAAELVYRMLRRGAEGTSFDPIVITGKKTSMPHGVPGQALISRGDFVTMDFGCIWQGYCSDMTRTVAVGHATEEMRNVYDVVLAAQRAGIGAARAGVRGCDIDGAARGVIAAAGFGEYFGHGFGHSLGLDIHEAPNASPSCREIMPVNAVISAEPGIYLPGRFGVRIEDVLILKDGGNENITHAPKELIILGE